MNLMKAKFTATCDAANSLLYVHSFLDELNVPQQRATTLFIDNQGALMMCNAQQWTGRTCLIDCIDQDLLTIKFIPTSDNDINSMTIVLGQTLHY